ncbi:heat stress transcription factor A-5-like [Cynara cardunculus var. scolymus]|uniref:Heat stress transcription factor n=1 Tax=Cynara cardunculus var. scolymus TaxID=59895 RepID=A0A103Y0N6_CYNCS|nr:heat stress transcription factor A-5-like [Cynara cardunculus var. scolymus]KVI00374.1 Heat shock factor (HSF)-type, DNA-binding [Cynara cardunculus var. scolymus]
MEGNQSASAGGGGGGPAPFLLKTYDMVDDSLTDEIVSWSSNRNSFVVWNPPEFARLLLPTYFKHNNFSSFIRQLNTYGFRKIDPERWEFANEEFVKDQKHLLKNIHRRKPIHSHSIPQSSTVDPERAAFEEEIDKLTREKTSLEKSVSRFKQQQPATKLQLEDLTQRVNTMEQRQDTLLAFMKKATQNPEFVEHLARKLESMDFSAENKKRRLPRSRVFPDDGLVDNHSPQSPSRPDFGNVFHHDFSNKLRLELSPAVSDINFISNSTQSSNEDGGSPQIRLFEGCTRTPPGGLPFAPETQELSDTCTSFGFNMESSFMPKTGPCNNPSVRCLQPPIVDANEESDGHLSCQLNLTLASCVSQINPCQETDTIPPSFEDIGKPSEWTANARVPEKNRSSLVGENEPTKPAPPATSQARVNDVFWEQFLTERPGSSDVEDASSNLKSTPSYEQEDRRSGHGSFGNSRNMQNLTL